jgi:hypothetical protein
VLELVRDAPNWFGALGVALTRPSGVPERRAEQDPWHPEEAEAASRPRRISDDLAWLRQAYDEPEANGLHPLDDTAAVAAWELTGESSERLQRLRERRVLDAAGFLLHDDAAAL